MVKPPEKMTGCEREIHETRTRSRSESNHKRCRGKHTNDLDNHCDNRRTFDEGAREVCGHWFWDSAQYGEYGTVPAEWDGQRSICRCEMFTFGGTFGQAVVPLQLGSSAGLIQRRDPLHVGQKTAHTDEWMEIYQAIGSIENIMVLEKTVGS